VAVLGGGVVGTAAARIALGMGAHVTILDISPERMTYLEDIFGDRVETLYSNAQNIEEAATWADLVVGAVLIPGGAAPKLVSRELLTKMSDGSVVVDVAVDQGGCIETCRPTTHDDPTYVVEGVVHYCVANMPGAVPQTSTVALTNATLAYARSIAKKGVVAAVRDSHHLANGVNTWDGACTVAAVAQAHGLEYTPLAKMM
jgi:alanine dehydrogenase